MFLIVFCRSSGTWRFVCWPRGSSFFFVCSRESKVLEKSSISPQSFLTSYSSYYSLELSLYRVRVVYFTAIFPYVVLIILLIRAVTLPGKSCLFHAHKNQCFRKKLLITDHFFGLSKWVTYKLLASTLFRFFSDV